MARSPPGRDAPLRLFPCDGHGAGGATRTAAHQSARRLCFAHEDCAEAIIELARDRRYVGGTVGVLAVLHTWTQQLIYHPHVHCLVTGGGVSADGRDWYPARKGYLFPERALAKLVRGKLKALLAQKRPDLIAPAAAWKKPWVVHITPWGED